MTEEQKRRLTEFIGECWHDVTDTYPLDPPGSQHCDSCEEYVTSKKSHINRTFDTWPDLGACKDALVREGLWGVFYTINKLKWHQRHTEDELADDITSDANYAAWLFRPFVIVNEKKEAHFCALVAEFLEAEK